MQGNDFRPDTGGRMGPAQNAGPREAGKAAASGNAPEVKICGLTEVEEAVKCAELGANAIGLVFYPPSPRCVTMETARDITGSLSREVVGVGVFVDEGYRRIMEVVERCGLKAVQLHGAESPELVRLLGRTGLIVIKTFFAAGDPPVDREDDYEASASLVECARGRLPGGNGTAWDWGAVRCSRMRPLILAGGLGPGNVVRAIREAAPDAVDVSSGVEARPGTKDLDKVKRFIDAVRNCRSATHRRLFR